MPAFKNKDLLKSKFQGIEMSLEDTDLNYKILPEKIEQIKTVKQNSTSLLFIYSSYISRWAKVVSIMIGSAASFIMRHLIIRLFEESKKIVFVSVRKIGKMRSAGENKAEDFLKKIEAELEIKNEEKKLLMKRLDEDYQLIQKDFSESFNIKSVKVLLHCNKSDLEKGRAGLEFDLSIFEKLSQKLTKTKMNSNVSHLNIDIRVEKKYVRYKLEFKLCVLGEKWSRMFAQHFSSKVLADIKNYNGVVKSTFVQHVSPVSEAFILTFSHQRLDLFLDPVKADGISPVDNMIKVNSQMDM